MTTEVEITIKVVMEFPDEWEKPNHPEYGPLEFWQDKAGEIRDWAPRTQRWVGDGCINLRAHVTSVDIEAGEWGGWESREDDWRPGVAIVVIS